MTSARRFEQDLPALLDDLYVAGTPDYRDDLVRQTAALRQRPAWTFPERWLPMDLATRRMPFASVPFRALIVLAVILVMAAAALLVAVGSQHRLPPPFGLARNGAIAYVANDDVLVSDPNGANSRTLIGGSDNDHSPTFSPDGTRLMFVRVTSDGDFLWGADADGTNQRPLFDQPLGDPKGGWSPDSRTIAMTNPVAGVRRLLLIHADGSPPDQIDLGSVVPTDVAWRPPFGHQLLVRARTPSGKQDFVIVNLDGTGNHALGLKSDLAMGETWDNSGPAWSPTGDRIAYNVVEPGGSGGMAGTFRVHLMDADGSHDVGVPQPDIRAVQEAWPTWSPDGGRILVHRWTWQPGGWGWLAVMPADGSAPAHDIGQPFPGGQETGLVETWSPDGTRVIVRVGNTERIYSIDPQANAEVELPWTGSDLPDYQRLAP